MCPPVRVKIVSTPSFLSALAIIWPPWIFAMKGTYLRTVSKPKWTPPSKTDILRTAMIAPAAKDS